MKLEFSLEMLQETSRLTEVNINGYKAVLENITGAINSLNEYWNTAEYGTDAYQTFLSAYQDRKNFLDGNVEKMEQFKLLIDSKIQDFQNAVADSISKIQ